MENDEIYSGLRVKVGASCFFCSHEGHFRIDCPVLGGQKESESNEKQNGASSKDEQEKHTGRK